MFTAALSTTGKAWKQPKCLSVDEWGEKMWYLHTVGYYSAIKIENLTSVTTAMDLDSIMLNEVSQSGKTSTIWFRFYMESKEQYTQTNKIEIDS